MQALASPITRCLRREALEIAADAKDVKNQDSGAIMVSTNTATAKPFLRCLDG